MSLAREQSKHLPSVSYSVADGQSLSFDADTFDAVVFHTTLCHVPEPLKAIREAYRVLKPGAQLAAFDGDYVSTTVATTDFDPLQAAVDTMMGHFLQNRWLTRQLPKVLRDEGFVIRRVRSHGFVQTGDANYMVTVIERGADLLVASGNIGLAAGDAIKLEAKRRVEQNEFFGHIAFLSVLAAKGSRGDG